VKGVNGRDNCPGHPGSRSSHADACRALVIGKALVREHELGAWPDGLNSTVTSDSRSGVLSHAHVYSSLRLGTISL
jgi:hypothetical protein